MVDSLILEAEKSLGENIKEALLPEDISFLGIGVNPSFITALITSGILILFALIVRIFVIPKFKTVPGKFQALLEKACEFFENMVKENSPEHFNFIGAYAFTSSIFIGLGTLFEMLGLRAVMADLNACFAVSLTSFVIILAAAIKTNKFRGLLGTLKDISLPLSMSFRLFGSMLSGLMVTELVYQFIALSIVVPVIVGIIFTVFHAVLQSYIFSLLTSMFYGEAMEKHEKKPKIKKNKTEKLQKIQQ